jgi:hypothetical protein
MSSLALIISSLGIGGLLGAFAKAIFDKRQLRFSKVFDYKERRYQAIVILMWAALNLSGEELEELTKHWPDIKDAARLDRELELEYHNATLYASKKVRHHLRSFIDEKTLDNWQLTVAAMKKDLYLKEKASKRACRLEHQSGPIDDSDRATACT